MDLNLNVVCDQNTTTTAEKFPESSEGGVQMDSSIANADAQGSRNSADEEINDSGTTRSELATRHLLPVVEGGGDKPACSDSALPTNEVDLRLRLAVSGGLQQQPPPQQQQPPPQQKQMQMRSRPELRSPSSKYRGVTFYRRTGRWESNIWDCGKQVYLGGFETAHDAARAYDRAAIKIWGIDADINFNLSDYDEDMNQVKHLTKKEYVYMLRSGIIGFSRGSSNYRRSIRGASLFILYTTVRGAIASVWNAIVNFLTLIIYKIDLVYSLVSLFIEGLTAAADQLSYPGMPHFIAINILVLSIFGCLLCFLEFIFVACKENAHLRRFAIFYWFAYPTGRIYGSFSNVFGLLASILQTVLSMVQYVYYRKHDSFPIKFSTYPLLFATCVVGNRIFRSRTRAEYPCTLVCRRRGTLETVAREVDSHLRIECHC